MKIETWTEDEAVSRREQETRRSQSQHVKAPPKLNFAFTNEYDPISEHLNRPANRDRISSNNERVDYLFLNNRSRSIPNRGENPLSSGFTHNHVGMDYLKDHQPPNVNRDILIYAEIYRYYEYKLALILRLQN